MIRLIAQNFIPVADNDWYSRRRKDAVGQFFRKVADQGPRNGEGGSTRQGAYVLTADGKLLGYNNNRGFERRKGMIEEALKAWNAIPENARAPGAIKVPDISLDELDGDFVRTPPEDGVILEVFTRALVSGENGYSAWNGNEGDEPGTQSARDHMWLKKEEWKALLQAGRSASSREDAADIPKRLACRLIRFHLVDSTRGEPPMWNLNEMKSYEMTIYQMKDGGFRINGKVLLEAEGKRGFSANLSGEIRVYSKSGRPSKFEILALGEHWGEGTFTRGARKGKSPLGIAFRLAADDAPGRAVPPQASSWEKGYYEAEK